MLFVGSCFADNIGQRFKQEKFRADVNPYGVMYNPASILHTISKLDAAYNVAVITLGTNHIYILKSTGEIVDNCQKRPQRLFEEHTLDFKACADFLQQAIARLRARNPQTHVVLTVSPIRYRKYGYHNSQLSKSVLLLAADEVCREDPLTEYFPAYEIMNDELRDYRFYQPDMLHPSEQAVEYIFQRFGDTYFGPATRQFLQEWKPLKEALGHRPFHPESEEYKEFMKQTHERIQQLAARYPGFEL